jgi:hypothetical protein
MRRPKRDIRSIRTFTWAFFSLALAATVHAGAVTKLTTNTVEELNTDAAVDVAGNVHVVFERGGNIYYRGRAGAAWSAEELVAAGTNPAVGAGASGVPQVAFLSGGGIWFTARVGGTWMAPVPIAAGSTVDLAVDAADVGHVVYIGDTYLDGYHDVNYTSNAGGAFPPSPIRVWNGWYMNWGGGSGDGNYYNDMPPLIAVDPTGNYAVFYHFRWWSRYPGGTDWGTSLHVYRSATDTDISNADRYKAYYPAPGRNGLALDGSGTAYLAFGSNLGAVGAAWSESPLPAGSAHTLGASPGALHVGFVDAANAVNYAVDDGSGLSPSLVLDPTATGRTPIVLPLMSPLVAYEAVDTGDYEVWTARTTNEAPVLDEVGDQSVDEGATLSFAVSGTDGDGDDLTYSASGLPTGASFDPATRTFSWTPGYDQAGGYTGVTFEVGDGTDSDSEAIAITVNQVNAPPVLAAIGGQTVDEAASLTFTLSATEVDGDALAFSASNLPPGAAFDPATATFSWTPDHDQAGAHTGIVFTVTDDGTPSLSDSETVTITVTDVNRPPVLAPIGDKAIDENATLSFAVSGTDGDGDALAYSVSKLPAGATFDPATGSFSWTPGYDQAGDYTLTFTAADDGSPTLDDSETITVVVNDVNAPPVLAAIGDQSVAEAATLSFHISASDVDGDGLTYSFANLPAGATFEMGTFTWTPGYDQAGTHAGIVFTVTDDGTPNLADSESITITVSNVNRAPAFGSIGEQTVDEQASLSLTVSATDEDGDTLTYSASGLPSGASFDPATRTLSWTPGYDQSGTHGGIVFTVTDGTDSDTETVSVKVNDVNAPPVLAAIGDRSVSEGDTLTFTVSATDVDGNALTYSASGLPAGAAFDPATRTFSWTPDYEQAGAHTGVVFSVADDGSPSKGDTETITITVTDVNRAPELAAIGDRTVTEGGTLTFTVSATDADGDTLTYAASSLPAGASFDPATRTFAWTPGYDQAGSFPGLVFTVDDGTASDSESITVTVDDEPTPPGFFTVIPCRVLDTRTADGPLGGPALAANAARTFVLAGQCAIPASARAVSVNVTVTGASTNGNLRLYASGVPMPLVSTINYTAGITRANNAVVPLSALGELAVFCSQATGGVHFILDVNGYFQ